MIHRVIKSDSYRDDKEPLADLGLNEAAICLTGGRRRRIRSIEIIRGPHIAKPTTITIEDEVLGPSKLYLTTKAAREAAKGLLQNMTVEEVVADAELIGVLRAMLNDVNNFGRSKPR